MGKDTYRNSDLALNAILAAREVGDTITELKNNIEDLLGAEAPIVKVLYGAEELLSPAASILYMIDGDIDKGLKEQFHEWVSDPRETGPCHNCVYRIDGGNPGWGTQCRIHGGYYLEGYCCKEYETKEQ